MILYLARSADGYSSVQVYLLFLLHLLSLAHIFVGIPLFPKTAHHSLFIPVLNAHGAVEVLGVDSTVKQVHILKVVFNV